MKKFGWKTSVISIHRKNHYMLCEHWKERSSATSGNICKIFPKICSVAMSWKVNNKIAPQKITA